MFKSIMMEKIPHITEPQTRYSDIFILIILSTCLCGLVIERRSKINLKNTHVCNITKAKLILMKTKIFNLTLNITAYFV